MRIGDFTSSYHLMERRANVMYSEQRREWTHISDMDRCHALQWTRSGGALGDIIVLTVPPQS
jgi:hypothetical protein